MRLVSSIRPVQRNGVPLLVSLGVRFTSDHFRTTSIRERDRSVINIYALDNFGERFDIPF